MNNTLAFLKQKTIEFFGIDVRSLALFRISLGLLILTDLICRSMDLSVFYSDAGVLPRATIVNSLGRFHPTSLYYLSGASEALALMFIIQGLCALTFTLGYLTRWMTLFSCLLMAALQRRNPLVNSGGDTYLVLLLFWSLFLPLNACWSIDQRLRSAPKKSTRYFSAASVAILLQTVIIYWAAAAYKWNQTPWTNGTAIYDALHIDLFATGADKVLLLFPPVTTFLTHAVLWYEILGPCLLFSPIRTGRMRTFAVLGFIVLHMGFFFCLNLRLFPLVSMIAMFLFLPPYFWGKIGSIQKTQGSIRLKPSTISEGCVLFLLICVIGWNLQGLLPNKALMPRFMQRMTCLACLDQTWNMFCNPSPVSGYLVIHGQLESGQDVNLLNGGVPFNWTETTPQNTLKNERWRRYVEHLDYTAYKHYRRQYANYACRTWNERLTGSARLKAVQIDFVEKKTSMENAISVSRKISLEKYECP